MKTGAIIEQFADNRHVDSISISPDGRMLASGTFEVFEAQSNVWGDNDFAHAIQLWDIPTGRLMFTIQRQGDDARYEGHSDSVRSVVFSSDGRFLVSGSEDKTVRMWETVTGKQLQRWDVEDKVGRVAVSPDGKRIAASLRAGALRCFPVDPAIPNKVPLIDVNAFESLWADLGGADAEQAYRAVRSLSGADGDVPARIAKRLKPADGIARWLADLDNDDFDRREAASKQLAAFGAGAEPALRKALAETPSAEVRSRINKLLNGIGEWIVTDPDALRSLRAIWVLERIGTPEARTVLEDLAKGAPETRQTQEAKAALDWLDKRAAAKR